MSENDSNQSTWGTGGDSDAETRMAGAGDQAQDDATQQHEAEATQVAYRPAADQQGQQSYPSAPQAGQGTAGNQSQAYPSAPQAGAGQFSSAGYGEAPTQAAYASNQGTPQSGQAPYSQGYPGVQGGQQGPQSSGGYPSAPPTQGGYPSVPQGQQAYGQGYGQQSQQGYPSAPSTQASYPSAPQGPQSSGGYPSAPTSRGGYPSAQPGQQMSYQSGYPSAPQGQQSYQSAQPGQSGYSNPSQNPSQSGYGSQPTFGQQSGTSSFGQPAGSAPVGGASSTGSPVTKFGPFLPALFALIAAFLTWVTFKNGPEEVKLNGIGGNSNSASAALGDSKNMAGIFGIVLALGLVAVAVMAILNKLSAKVAGIVTAAIGAILLILALFQFISASQAVDGAAKGYEASIGMGVWLTLLAGLIALALGAYALFAGNKGTSSSSGSQWGSPQGQGSSGFGQGGQQGAGQFGQGGQPGQYPSQQPGQGGFGQR